MELECLLDLDGVITNFVAGAIKAHKYKEGVYDRPEHMGVFYFNEIMKISTPKFWEPLNNFSFWFNLEFMPDALQILDIVEAKFGRENICFLTSPSYDPQCAAAKQAYIQKYFPNYARRFLIGAAKHFTTSPWRVLIDDFDENVDNFNKKGRSILLPRLWNRNWRLNTIEHLKIELEKL